MRNPINPLSVEWLHIEEHIKKQLGIAREELERYPLKQRATVLCSRIETYLELLKLPDQQEQENTSPLGFETSM